jgi:hypothetical protein
MLSVTILPKNRVKIFASLGFAFCYFRPLFAVRSPRLTVVSGGLAWFQTGYSCTIYALFEKLLCEFRLFSRFLLFPASFCSLYGAEFG